MSTHFARDDSDRSRRESNMSRIDVVVPCYNYGRFLRECVESILSQPVNLRILIINDASTDDTEEVARQLVGQDERVAYRHHAINRGNIATYNEGLEWVIGEYHLKLDADDVLVPGALTRAIRLLDTEPSVGLVCGREIRFQSSDSKLLPRITTEPCPWKIIKGLDFIEACCFWTHNPVSTPTAIIRTALLRRVGFYRPDLPHGADLAMWLKYAAYADVGILDTDQAYYRIHSENMSKAMIADPLMRFRQCKLIFEAFFEDAGERLVNRETLRNQAFEAIARDALSAAYSAFHERDLDRCREMMNFAASCWPAIVHQTPYQWLRLKARIGPRGWNVLRALMFRPRISPAIPDEAGITAREVQIDHLRMFEEALSNLRRTKGTSETP
jgi:glycosyltransferase involved in cell wall biosynthesis